MIVSGSIASTSLAGISSTRFQRTHLESFTARFTVWLMHDKAKDIKASPVPILCDALAFWHGSVWSIRTGPANTALKSRRTAHSLGSATITLPASQTSRCSQCRRSNRHLCLFALAAFTAADLGCMRCANPIRRSPPARYPSCVCAPPFPALTAAKRNAQESVCVYLLLPALPAAWFVVWLSAWLI